MIHQVLTSRDQNYTSHDFENLSSNTYMFIRTCQCVVIHTCTLIDGAKMMDTKM